MTAIVPEVFRFEGYALDVTRGCLRRDDREIELRPKTFDVLRHLVENAGRLIPKDELIAAAWPDVIVTDDAITRCVSEIRTALGDHEQRIVKTVPRRGYLFAAAVSRISSPQDPENATSPISAGDNSRGWLHSRHPWAASAVAALLLIALTSAAFQWRAARELPLPDRPSIAVLPFTNISGDSTQDYFVDGISEELTTSLSKFSQLFVIAPHSAFTYRDKRADAKQIGRELGVRYVFEGSVRRAQDRLRITVQLIDARSGGYVWAERYERSVADIFAVQDDITERIVTTLVANIERVTIESARRKAPGNLGAYELYLQGRELMRTSTQENTRKAEQLFEKAIALDPGFAPPHAQLAFAQYLAVALQWDPQRRQEHLAKGFASVRRALTLAPSLPFAHLVLGDLYMRTHDYDNAVLWARKAVELNPSDAESYAGLANIYTFIGRSAEAVPLMQIALRHDPVHPPLYDFYLGRAYVFGGEYEKGIGPLRSCAQRAPDFWPCPTYLSVALAQLGRSKDAHDALDQSRRLHAMNSIREYVAQGDFRPDAQFDRVLEGLRKAGLPD